MARSRRYETDPGKKFQMDWGFSNFRCVDGSNTVIYFSFTEKNE